MLVFHNFYVPFIHEQYVQRQSIRALSFVSNDQVFATNLIFSLKNTRRLLAVQTILLCFFYNWS